MHGTYDDKQLPEFGNKVLGCHMCQLNIHGTPKTPTWTSLKSTADISATTLTLKVETNWIVGDKLVIASTDFGGLNSEEVEITSITHSSSGDSVTFTP